MERKVIISGVGCCLVDRLYNHINFSSEELLPYLTRTVGDGGLTPGKLVFKEEFDRFTGEDFLELLPRLTGGRSAEKMNIGGPCIVALIHAAQMSGDAACCRFYGCHGKDEDGRFLLSALRKTPVDIKHYIEKEDVTASTIVLSDPGYDGGNGERVFINTIGASWKYAPSDLDDEFFASDIVVFGGTALVPQIHDGLYDLLLKAKSSGCFTLVNTVFDFRNEKASPDRKWPLGKSDESYRHIDLLITDREEALRLSGRSSIPEALQFFKAKGAEAVVVTNGAKDIAIFSSGRRFEEIREASMPVSQAVGEELKKGREGDTTGCGDNFVGGMIASIVSQMGEGAHVFDLTEACRWGIVSGGFTCFYLGGTWFEVYKGEKRDLILPYYEQYKQQTGLCRVNPYSSSAQGK